VRIAGAKPGKAAAHAVWSGAGPDDKTPRLQWQQAVEVAGNELAVTLPAVSLTILTLPVS